MTYGNTLCVNTRVNFKRGHVDAAPVGNVDLSPLFVLIACQLLLMVPLAVLEGTVLRLL